MNILKVKVENVQNKSSKLERVTIFKKKCKNGVFEHIINQPF